MAGAVPKYAVLLNSLDDLLSEIPAKARSSERFQAKLKAFKALILVPAAGGRPPLSASEIAALPLNPRAESEVFLLDDREGNLYHLVGWSALLGYFGLKKPYVQVLVSKGRGSFVRRKGSVVYKVSRLGVPEDPGFLRLPPPPWAPGSREYIEGQRVAALRAEADAKTVKKLVKPHGATNGTAPPYVAELRLEAAKRGR